MATVKIPTIDEIVESNKAMGITLTKAQIQAAMENIAKAAEEIAKTESRETLVRKVGEENADRWLEILNEFAESFASEFPFIEKNQGRGQVSQAMVRVLTTSGSLKITLDR